MNREREQSKADYTPDKYLLKTLPIYEAGLSLAGPFSRNSNRLGEVFHRASKSCFITHMEKRLPEGKNRFLYSDYLTATFYDAQGRVLRLTATGERAQLGPSAR